MLVKNYFGNFLAATVVIFCDRKSANCLSFCIDFNTLQLAQGDQSQCKAEDLELVR